MKINMKFINKSWQEINITPQELGKLFCEMDNLEQVAFFNEVADGASEMGNNNFGSQMLEVARSVQLSYTAKQVMITMGEFAKEEL